MAPNMTNEEFRAAINSYREREHLSILGLAQKLKKNDSTVGDWVHKGIKRDSYRQRVIEQYPEIFDQHKQEVAVQAVVDLDPTRRHDLLVLLKTEQALPAVLNLTAILIWFLFKASVEQRNYFRDTLGDDWKHFLELTRAMTGETAFEVTKQEGRLEWCKK